MANCKRLGCNNEVVNECDPYDFISRVLKDAAANLTTQQREYYELKTALEEFVERVDNALLLDEQLADAWTDLCDGVVRARRVLDGVGAKK